MLNNYSKEESKHYHSLSLGENKLLEDGENHLEAIERLFGDKTQQAFVVDSVGISKNKYDLSINRYKEVVYEEEVYDPPKVILARLKSLEKEIMNELQELEDIL